MATSLAFVGVYAVLIGIASVIERPVGRGLRSVQLNFLIRIGSLAAALIALIATHGLSIPSGRYALLGLGIGLATGVGSIVYCLVLVRMPIALVVALSNVYVVITTLLGILLLQEPLTALKVAGLACTVGGVVLLAHPPSSRYGVHSADGAASKAPPLWAWLAMGGYVVVIGTAAFLEKPALAELDATQLNGLMAISMTAVAGVALIVERRSLPVTTRSLGAAGVGALIGVGSVAYFLGLGGLPVSVAAASSNTSVVVSAILSAVFLGQGLSAIRIAAIGLTLVGVTLLAISAG
jgi:drug/metabolite transporter (DMT)-like permease